MLTPIYVCHAAALLLQTNPLSLQWLPLPDSTKTHLRSGYDYNDGNYDSGNLIRVEPAGMSFSNVQSAWVLFEQQGPGVITSIWFTGKNKQGQAHMGGRLNFYFDGEPRPRLSGQLPDWLEKNPVLPAGLAEKSSGGWICYAPIYFAKSLKITLEDHGDRFTHRKNGRGETIPHIYHQFSHQRLPALVTSTTAESWSQTPLWEDAWPPLPPPQTVLLPTGRSVAVYESQGPGILEMLRLDFEAADAAAMKLQVEADGMATVNMSVREFWGFNRAQRPQARFRSLLMGVDESGAYYSRWPMPCRKSLRISLENPGRPVEVQVQGRFRQGWPQPELYYFRAARITDRTEKGRDIILLETEGRGHYVGCILELANATLEGDDRFYVDGEGFPPAWHGTGTEDYFRCGWYFHGGALTRPLYGLLDNSIPKIAYRFHLADRINFTNRVKIGFEHGHHNEYLGSYSGTVFWYAARQPAE
ncbi:DUF2961 domain-containing protein [Fontisphaera persica]|uniref:DUF2961 domain-containing protein n=1 Tax=Fontisphaera persica TaxID=2974023 RepID=UPI0024BF5596|nr:DUF2961 domain-containing protein [Fontisphaera persica]WCJ60558.1 DUF2961 domain-containing protein [Fontisphaera persica]